MTKHPKPATQKRKKSNTLKFLIATLLLTASLGTKAQDLDQCSKVVDKFMAAVSNHSVEGLEAYLAPDFTMAGQQQPVAAMVLAQLVPQMNETVKSYELTEQNAADGLLTLKYDVTYANLGTKTATFVFGSDNLVKECELIKMRAAVIQMGDTETPQGELKDVVHIPFTFHHAIPMVKVTVEGEERNFLFDSGAPMIMLNSEYYESTIDSTMSVGGMGRGVVSNVGEMGMYHIESLELCGIRIENQDLMTTDLSNLSTKREKIYGLIGFSFFSQYDVLFDYVKREIVFINPEKTDSYIQEHNYKTEWIPMSLNQHVASIECYVDGLPLKMGIDCGAQANLLGTDFLENRPWAVSGKHSTDLGGVGGSSKAYFGKVTLYIGNRKFKRQWTAFSDMTAIKGALGVDGLIGFQVLNGKRTLLSYKNQKMTFLE